MSNKPSKAEVDEARTKLRELLRPGDRVYTILRHVSASGMSRRISLVIIERDESRIRDISWLAERAMGKAVSDKQGVTVGGCGMDMGFHLVYELGSILWPNGTPEPHSTRNGEPDRAGGYALKQEWL